VCASDRALAERQVAVARSRTRTGRWLLRARQRISKPAPASAQIVDEQRLFDAWDGAVIAGQVVKERTLFLDISVAALVLSVLSLAPPLMFMIVIDRVLAHQSRSTLKVLGGALVLIAAFDTVFGYLRRCLTEVASASPATDNRSSGTIKCAAQTQRQGCSRGLRHPCRANSGCRSAPPALAMIRGRAGPLLPAGVSSLLCTPDDISISRRQPTF
jgi:hypothetical protein